MTRDASEPGWLPYTRHDVDEADVESVAAALRSPHLTGGPVLERFESALAERLGAAHVVACSSGTAALHLACHAAGLTGGETAIVPTVTFLATANVARYLGAEVTFSDVDPDTGLMRGGDLDAALERPAGTPRAVLPVHLNGQPAASAAIAERARARGLAVIEDASHALGTTYAAAGETVTVGDCRFADAAAFSFHPSKTIAAGEGGALATNDAELAARARRLRNHGMVRDRAEMTEPAEALDDAGEPRPWHYELSELGYNYRLSEVHAALGLSQLDRLDALAERRRRLAARYDAALAPLAPLVRPLPRVAGCEPVLHLYPVLIDFEAAGTRRAAVMRALEARGIGSQVHYRPVHRQPYYRRRYGERDLPGARAYYERVLSLPFFPAMEDADVDRVVAALREVVER